MSNNTDLVVIDDTESMFDYANMLIKKKLIPSSIKNPEDVVSIVNKGKHLGMDPLTALNSMNMIQGNIALKSSVVPGLLARAGIAVELIKDYEPVMQKVYSIMRDEDGKPMMADDDGNFKYYRNPEGEIAYKEEPVTYNKMPEYVTVIRFHRYYPEMNKTISSDYSFYWSDAVKANWVTKDNWKKLPRFMMYARCVVRGARGVASDIMGGLYDSHEVVEFTKAESYIDENNDAIPI